MRKIIIALALPQLIGTLFFVLPYALAAGEVQLSVFAVVLALLSLLVLAALFLRKPWALWAILTIASLKATVNLFAWSVGIEPTMILISSALLLVIVILVFREPVPSTRSISVYQRVLFIFVLIFAARVAVPGLFFPSAIGNAIPFMVPALHARILGAMYLSGSVFMVLGLFAGRWCEVRVMTLQLGIWTGMLGLVSMLHLEAFNWSKATAWLWFFAYICYPLLSFWIVWCQRHEKSSDESPEMANWLRGSFYVQGGIATLLAVALFVAPGKMTTVWPWTLPPLLAHIYCAPFFAYGIGCLYAARQRTWSEVRITVFGTLVFASGVLSASLYHRQLFGEPVVSTYLWFGGFGLFLALSLSALIPSLRSRTRQVEHLGKE
jgi:hypothetical protein